MAQATRIMTNPLPGQQLFCSPNPANPQSNGKQTVELKPANPVDVEYGTMLGAERHRK
jgi:hypothetical protein